MVGLCSFLTCLPSSSRRGNAAVFQFTDFHKLLKRGKDFSLAHHWSQTWFVFSGCIWYQKANITCIYVLQMNSTSWQKTSYSENMRSLFISVVLHWRTWSCHCLSPRCFKTPSLASWVHSQTFQAFSFSYDVTYSSRKNSTSESGFSFKSYKTLRIAIIVLKVILTIIYFQINFMWNICSLYLRHFDL